MGFIPKWFVRPHRVNNEKTYEEQNIFRMFEDLEELYYKTHRVQKYYKELETREEEIKQYERLDAKDIEKLTKLINEYKTIEEKRQLLRGRLIKNNRALYLISQYEEELPKLIKEMSYAEKKKKENETDMIYLEEEWEDLIAEREVTIKGYHFLKVFSIIFIITTAVATLLMFGMLQTIREDIWVYLSIFGCVLVIFLAGIIYSKEHLEKLLRDNQILQQKAGKYLNKAKIRYFHHTNYLNFNYEKLGIDSTAKLELYYNRFIKNKDNEKEYARFTKLLVTIQEKIEELFKTRDIYVEHVDSLSDWLVASKKANAMKSVLEDKQHAKDQLDAFATYQEELWKEIFVLKEDERYEDIIMQKMDDYMLLTKEHLDKVPADE